MYEKHAKLSASGATRWLACPKSVALEAKFEDTTSVYALEGTLAHNVAEAMLLDKLPNTNSANESYLNRVVYDENMKDYVNSYVEHCMELFTQAKLSNDDFIALVEERLAFDEFVPGGFGTGDFMIVTPKKLIVVDLKYGKGVKVDAPDNPQLRLYGLGGIQEYGWIYPFTTVEMHIVQPRLNHVSVEVLSRVELLEWAKNEVIEQAKMADNDEGEFKPGDHCRWCKANHTCTARAFGLLGTISNIIQK